MGAELSHHLGYRPGEHKPSGVDNHRNGTTGKTVLTDGPVRIEVPRLRLDALHDKGSPGLGVADDGGRRSRAGQPELRLVR